VPECVMSIDHNGRLGSQEAAHDVGLDGKGVEDRDNPDSFPVQARSRSVAHSNEQKAAA